MRQCELRGLTFHRQGFDRDEAIEGQVEGFVDLPYCAAADDTEDAISPREDLERPNRAGN